jgi:hypothetical protein
MPDRSGDPWTMLMYLLGAVTGGLGGCSVGALLYIRGKELRPQLILAYSVMGLYFGLVGLVLLVVWRGVPITLENVMMYGGIIGAGSAFLLSGANISIRFASRKFFGKEFVLLMRDVEPKGDPDDR